MATLFSTLSSSAMARFISRAREAVCYVGPGIHVEPARAIAQVARDLGPEMISVSLDFDERVMRMGFGSVEAASLLRTAGIVIQHVPGLRSALVIVDGEGFVFTPTPLYLEAEPRGQQAFNALRLSHEQVSEGMARLSPAAKAIAVARSDDPQEKSRLVSIPVEMSPSEVGDLQFQEVERSLDEAPAARFDLARQVRVFEPYLQYVELSLSGVAIHRHRLTIPPEIQRLGGSKDLEGRLRTTFELIEKGGKVSSKQLEDELNEIRSNFTRSLGKDRGRVVLRRVKPHLEARLEVFRKKLDAHRETVRTGLQQHLDKSREEIIGHYLPRTVGNPPEALLGQLITSRPSEEDAKDWLESCLDRVFPKAEALIQAMRLDIIFKDVTFETLSRQDFLEAVKTAYPNLNWDKPYSEFKAAGESAPEGDVN